MSQSPNFKAILQKMGNFIAHHKFLAFLTLISTLISGVGVFIAFLALPQFQPEEVEQSILCPQSTYSINIKHPESWELNCTEDAFSGEVAKLIASKDSVKLLIEVHEFQKLMALDEYVSSLRENIKKNSNDIEIIEKKETLGNRPAYQLDYTVEKGQSKFKRKEVIMLDTGLAYHLIYEAPTYEYNSFKNDVEEMIKSFAIVEDK